MKKVSSFFMVSLTILMVLMLAACGTTEESSNKETEGSNANSSEKSNTETKEKYIIGTDITFPPFEYEENGKHTGFDIELIQAIAEVEGFEIELKPMNFKGIIPGLTSGQLDAAVAAMTVTEERKKVIDFSDVYYISGLSMVVHKDNNDISGVEDLAGKKLAAKKGTTASIFAEKAAKEYGAEVIYFDSTPNMFQAVVNKNADVTFEDRPVIHYKISVDPTSELKIVGGLLEEYPTAVGVSKKNPELLEKINSGLEKLRDNGKSVELISKYME